MAFREVRRGDDASVIARCRPRHRRNVAIRRAAIIGALAAADASAILYSSAPCRHLSPADLLTYGAVKTSLGGS